MTLENLTLTREERILAFGDFIFLRAQKNEAKKGRPCGELAQRKSFLR